MVLDAEHNIHYYTDQFLQDEVFVCVFVCLATPWSLWDLSSLSKDQTLAFGKWKRWVHTAGPGNWKTKV